MKPDDIADIVEAAVKPLISRIKELEAREFPAPVSLDEVNKSISDIAEKIAALNDDIAAIKSIDVNPVISELIELNNKTVYAKIEELNKALSEFTVPEIPMEDIRQIVDKTVSDKVSAIPVPENGKSVTVDDVKPLISELIEHAVKSIPVAKDGIGMAGAMIDRDGNLQITMSDGTVKDLGRVEGKDGLDGVSLDSLEREYLTETHEIRETWSVSGRKKELTYPAGGIRHGGYWADGTKAVAGSVWNLHGNAFIALKDTSSKPDVGASDWALFVRKGKDGETVVREKRENKPIKLSGAES